MAFRPQVFGLRLPFQFDYYLMLGALIGFYLLMPVGVMVLTRYAWIIHLFYCLLLFSGVMAAETNRRAFVVSIVLATGVFVLGWIPFIFGPSTAHRVVYLVFNLAFVSFTVFVLLRAIFLAGRVNTEAICAALCVYFLIGLFWSFGYQLIERMDPGAFDLSAHAVLFEEVKAFATEEGLEQLHAYDIVEAMIFTYYSLITLTTVGYGDVTPLHPLAMTLSAIQGFLGQIYIAVLVGWLVGVRVSASVIARQAAKSEVEERKSEVEEPRSDE